MNSNGININDYFEFLDSDDIRIKGTRVGHKTQKNWRIELWER